MISVLILTDVLRLQEKRLALAGLQSVPVISLEQASAPAACNCCRNVAERRWYLSNEHERDEESCDAHFDTEEEDHEGMPVSTQAICRCL